MTNLNELMNRRQEIAFELVEADHASRKKLNLELADLENEIELGTGQTIEQVDATYFKEMGL
jgi:hypothetical protein